MLPHFTAFEVQNASSTSKSSVDHWIIIINVHNKVDIRLEGGSSQQGLPSSSVWANVWQPGHVITSRRLAQIPMECHAGGRQRSTTPIQNRCIVVQARRHPFVNATTLRNELRNVVRVNISTQTVHNSLRQSGLRSRTQCIRIPLTRLHKQAHLNWAHEHVNWTDKD